MLALSTLNTFTRQQKETKDPGRAPRNVTLLLIIHFGPIEETLV